MEEAGSLKTLPFRAGCTAPPPTPVRRAEPADAIAAHLHHHRPDDHPSRPCDGDVGKDGDGDGDAPRIGHQSSSPPSRAELDELSRYLMQQLAAPLLSSPRRKPKASPPCGDEAAVDGSRNEGRKIRSSPLCSDEAAADRSREEEQDFQSLLAGCGAGCGGLSVHTFCTEKGIFKDGKMGILRACEEEGAFYVQCTDIGRASCSQIDSICKQCPAIDGIGVIGSYPLLSLSQLMTFDGSQEPNGFSSHQPEDGSFESPLDFSSVIKDTSFAEATIDFRNAVIVLQNLMFKISKELLKILLEEVCCKDQTNLQGHFIKPELYMCKHSGNEPAKCDKDVILSITSPGNASHQGYNERNMLLVVLGSYIQSWSKEKYKTPSLFSSVDLADAKICLRLDLVYHI